MKSIYDLQSRAPETVLGCRATVQQACAALARLDESTHQIQLATYAYQVIAVLARDAVVRDDPEVAGCFVALETTLSRAGLGDHLVTRVEWSDLSVRIRRLRCARGCEPSTRDAALASRRPARAMALLCAQQVTPPSLVYFPTFIELAAETLGIFASVAPATESFVGRYNQFAYNFADAVENDRPAAAG